jgi:release factor glutamine methyltransferase
MWATDICARALETAKSNAARLLPPDSIRFYQGDLFEGLEKALDSVPHLAFDIIVSNPPYIPTADIAGLSPEVRAEPALALNGGTDGLDIITRIIAEAQKWLCQNGSLIMEADPWQMERITTLLAEHDFVATTIFADLSGNQRVIQGKKPQ